MKILGLIPARGGSKRLPGKNIKSLGGTPLIGWTIRAAQESGVCSTIIVSTDDTEIAKISKEQGAEVPSLRPTNLATDTATSVEVALHALELFEAENGPVDALILLQPTSPFRTSETIRRGAALFMKNYGQRSVVAVSPAKSHPGWCLRIKNSEIDPYLGWAEMEKRSQDLDPAWILNGSFYMINPNQLKNEATFINQKTLALEISIESEALDIDTIEDWQMAVEILKHNHQELIIKHSNT